MKAPKWAQMGQNAPKQTNPLRKYSPLKIPSSSHVSRSCTHVYRLRESLLKSHKGFQQQKIKFRAQNANFRCQKSQFQPQKASFRGQNVIGVFDATPKVYVYGLYKQKSPNLHIEYLAGGCMSENGVHDCGHDFPGGTRLEAYDFLDYHFR